MKTSPPLHLAGYQGGTSILTAALTHLARSLDGSAVGTPHLLTDVTAQGESAASLFDSVERGERQIGYMASGYLSARVPELAVLDLPFSVHDRGAALAALDGVAGDMLRAAVARQSGFHVLAFWDNGFRHISNAVRPLRTPADCAGLAIRTLDSELYRRALGALGFEAITTDVKDLVRVVRDGTVQAQENPLTNLLGFDLWQHHPHVSLTGHFFGVLLLVCPGEWYARLDPTQREQLQETVHDATALQRRSAAAQDVTALERLRAHGVQVLGPEAIDLPALRRATAAVRQQYVERLPTELVQAYLPIQPTIRTRDPMKVKAIRFHAAGAPDVLQLDELELPDPGAGEVRIRHTAIGLNFQDIYARSGQYPVPTPSGLGTEAAGVVEAVGAGVTDFKTGDRVCYISGPVLGAYASHRNYPAERLLHSPDHTSDEQLAAMMLKAMTVEYLLCRCYPVQKGQHVLMHAAAGGVGLLAGQWGRHLGAHMIGVVAGPEKAALARANGYEHVIDRLGEDVAARVKEITGGAGVPVVFDSVGKNSFEQSLNSLAPRGYFVSFGTTTGAPPPVAAATLQKMGSLYFTRPTLVTYTASTADLRASAAAVFDMRARGVLNVSINQRYALTETARAHTDLAAGRTSGSSVILP